MEAPITGQVVESAGARYGLLGIGIVVLAFVVAFLVRLYLRTNDGMGVERERMVKEREAFASKEREIRAEHVLAIAELKKTHELAFAKLETEHERVQKELSNDYGKGLGEQNRAARDNETTIRREHAETVEKIAAETAAANGRTNALLDKLTDRIVLTTRRGSY